MKEARAFGQNLGISTKYAIEICAYLRNKSLSRAKKILERVLEKKEAIPFRRFTDGVGHRPGNITSGRYPVKASKAILSLIKVVEANAVNQGLTGNLLIKELRANKASTPMKGGRQSRREMKRTHVYITITEEPIKIFDKDKGASKKNVKNPVDKDTKKEVKKEPEKIKEEVTKSKANSEVKSEVKVKKEVKTEIKKEDIKNDNKSNKENNNKEKDVNKKNNKENKV